MGVSDLEPLVAPPVVVVLPEPDEELRELPEASRGMGVKEVHQCLVAAFVFPPEFAGGCRAR